MNYLRQIAQSATTEPATLRRQFAQPLSQSPVIGTFWLVPDDSAVHANQCKRPTFAHPVMLPGDKAIVAPGRWIATPSMVTA